MIKKMSKSNFRIWLAVVGTATLVLGATYAMTQQSTRLAADDLPLATAQRIHHELDANANPGDVVPDVKTNLASDSTVFVIITDNSHHVIASSADLNGKTPLPPEGVFDFTKEHGNDHFTWEPAKDVRLATRVIAYGSNPDDGYIITGQSLQQAENRINTYGALALAAWIAVVAWASLTLLLPSPDSVKEPRLKTKK